MADKIYLQKCSVKKSKFGLKFSANAEALIEQILKYKNSKGYFNLDITDRKEIGKFGDTHSVSVDQWEPTAPANITEPVSDLPF